MAEEITDDERAYAQAVFAHQIDGKSACEFCGGLHSRMCRRVKEITYHTNGELRRIRFWRDDEWDASDVIWPEDVYDEGELVNEREQA